MIYVLDHSVHPNAGVHASVSLCCCPCRLVHVAVGTPGRLVALAQAGTLACDSVSMLVLDEADALLGEGFYGDVTWLYDQLPRRKQVRRGGW
jgi:hypothetical protein